MTVSDSFHWLAADQLGKVVWYSGNSSDFHFPDRQTDDRQMIDRQTEADRLIDYKHLSWWWGADRKICPRVCAEWCQTVIPWDRFFYPHRTTMIDSFSCISFWSPAFDCNIGVAMNESCFFTLTSSILKVDIVCDVAMTSTPNVLMTELRDPYTTSVLTTRVVMRFLSIPQVG